jgi:type IX secretion system PorP/SprF family membrane protein
MIFAKFSFSQSIQFSQFYSAPLVLAPSFTGSVEQSRIIANFRDQWPGIPGTYTTFSASYDQYFPKIKSGMGLLALKDQAGSGDLGLLEVGFLYSWEGTITKQNGGWYFKPGIEFKMVQRSIDFHKLIFGDQITSDGTPSGTTIEVPPAPNKSYLDAATSIIVYNSKYFWGGISFDHLFRPNESLYDEEDTRVSLRTSVFAGYKMTVGQAQKRRQYDADQESVTFTAHYRYQRPYDQLDFGAYWDHDPFTLGIWLRGLPITSRYLYEKKLENMDAVVFLVGYKIFDLRIGYSYDLTISKLLGNTGGAHEISLIYEFNANLKTKNKHATIPCPKF